MTKRSLPRCIFFTCITFGIYGLFWMYKMADEIISELGYNEIDSAKLNVLFSIITFGTYILWWNYKMSNYLATCERKKNVEPDFWAPVFSLTFGLVLHQSRINRMVASN